MNNNELILIATFIPFALVVTVVVIVVLFIRKKNKLLREKQANEIRYLSEINKAKIEVKDAVLSQVADELHDNIGQMLALNLMYVRSLQKSYDEEKANSLKELVESTLNEVRQLAKLLNHDLIQRYRLTDAIEKLISYLSKLNVIKIVFEKEGQYKKLDSNIELVIFRMCQEFIGNSLKHASCDLIAIKMTYLANRLDIEIKDNGIGFDIDEVAMGTGLVAIKKRAQIINATANIQSSKGAGTSFTLTYNFN